ncbi:ectonucleotide pyrophosphatase/phosphodiesterase [Armatimonas rosea]|uniref:Putative AlkP superfamily pyrophosphatase or phosphodiesterase n=1 Tax=Armatimonas rosea TaxID=685828 RepID=A0A7W9STI9_ARMRO|nr:ectonucleotide pyrophosphatase/phosphodiesterase [Armatimonas rosea]MBB6052571.1 putative AlkP superfamily pyrophosphatase or phosphodiesterase [Armatimonas rosea]
MKLARAEHVFIVSFDGGKPGVMQQSNMPTLQGLLKEGAGTWAARTVFPSITLVSHTSMLTGVQPAKHKIDWNDWKPEKGVVGVPTVFAVATKAKKTTALFAGKEKFAHLYQPKTLNAFAVPEYSAKTVAQTAATYLQENRPNLCFVHFADSDGAGHSKGWGSPEQIEAFGNEDKALKVLLEAIRKAGIQSRSAIILTADHGGHEKTHGTASDEDMLIPWIAWGAGIRRGATLTLPISTCDTAATALELLGIPIPADWDGKPVYEALA